MASVKPANEKYLTILVCVSVSLLLFLKIYNLIFYLPFLSISVYLLWKRNARNKDKAFKDINLHLLVSILFIIAIFLYYKYLPFG